VQFWLRTGVVGHLGAEVGAVLDRCDAVTEGAEEPDDEEVPKSSMKNLDLVSG